MKRNGWMLCSITLFWALAISSFSQTAYFGQTPLAPNQPLNRSLRGYYMSTLKGLGEPPLYPTALKNKALESYRFLLLRSFDPVVVVRLDRNSDGSGVVITKVSKRHGEKPNTDGSFVAKTLTRSLTRAETDAFLVKVDAIRFSSIAPFEVPDQTGTDGSYWVIESVKDGHYHIVSRWSPTLGGSPAKQAIAKLGLSFLDMSQLNIPKDDIY